MARPYSGPPPEYPYDDVPEREPLPDPGFSVPVLSNPDGSDAGPLHLSPEAGAWIDEHVIDAGFVIDWGTREIIDPETGESRGTVPRHFPRIS